MAAPIRLHTFLRSFCGYRKFSSFSKPVVYSNTNFTHFPRSSKYLLKFNSFTTSTKYINYDRRKTVTALLFAVSVAGIFYYVREKIMSNFDVEDPDEEYVVQEPFYTITHEVNGPNPLLFNSKPRLFQYQYCTQCSKIRTYLEYYGLSYDIIEVNPLFKHEMKRVEHPEVPVILIKAGKFTKQLTDSSHIISVFHSYIENMDFDEMNSALMKYPLEKGQNTKKKEEFKIKNKYDVFYDSKTFSGEKFNSVIYNFKENERESLYSACEEWISAIGSERKFMGGMKPNLADLAVFGVIRSIEGCTAFQDVLQNTNIKSWYFEMKEAVTSHQGVMITVGKQCIMHDSSFVKLKNSVLDKYINYHQLGKVVNKTTRIQAISKHIMQEQVQDKEVEESEDSESGEESEHDSEYDYVLAEIGV
ncbi:Prostaglandin E synthase 2 [Nymphon striatum]|nr:Prostaglandin E synthase 2 [Nymphon striatum]